MKGKSMLSAVLILACVTSGGMIANAEAFTKANVTIYGGGIHFAEIPQDVDFGEITLDGLEITKTSPMSLLSVVDARGTGDGWAVQISASQFTDTTAAKKLAKGSLVLNKPVIAAGYNNPSASPFIRQSFGMSQPIDGYGEIAFINADMEAGLGKWNFDWEGSDALKLTLNPGSTKIGTYESTITWTLITNPNP